jgi:hypothetical protein
MVDSADGVYAKKYKFQMFDNPLYASEDKKKEILSSMVGMPESVRNTRLYGDWSLSAENVYYTDWDSMVEMPPDYSPYWRHVECVDPALSSALGLTVWAEHPQTGVWYCVMAEYVKGVIVPTALVAHIREKTKHLNIVRRISDPHEVWYIQTAASMGLSYMGVFKKNERKGELIKGLQEALSSRKIRISPHCDDLWGELQECRWSDKAAGKIVNASSYHLLDSAQYFVDCIPPATKKPPELTVQNWHRTLLEANQKRLATEEKKAAADEKKNKGYRMMTRRKGWWR